MVVLLLLDLLLELYLLLDPSLHSQTPYYNYNFLYHHRAPRFRFSMRSSTKSPLYWLSMYSTHLLTSSLLSVNAFPFLSLTMFGLTCRSLKFTSIFPQAMSTFSILNSVFNSRLLQYNINL